MNSYRVLLQDTVNGESFNFAIDVYANSWEASIYVAQAEFPEAVFISSKRELAVGV